jgi:very-short-patch-repair endonuclease
MLLYNKAMKSLAQELRRNATPQEEKLWYQFLRRHECRFTRQKAFSNYIVDFYCHSKKLVIEVDGSQHYTEDGIENDQIRTSFLEALGLHVMRFQNAEVDESMNQVCAKIQRYISAFPTDKGDGERGKD